MLTPDLEDWAGLPTLTVPREPQDLPILQKTLPPTLPNQGEVFLVARALVPAPGQEGRGPGRGQRGNPHVHTHS